MSQAYYRGTFRGQTHPEPKGEVRPLLPDAVWKCCSCGATIKTTLDLAMHFCVPMSLKEDRSIDEDGGTYHVARHR